MALLYSLSKLAYPRDHQQVPLFRGDTEIVQDRFQESYRVQAIFRRTRRPEGWNHRKTDDFRDGRRLDH